MEDFKKELPESEIYVMNNRSTDKSAELAKAAGARIVGTASVELPNYITSMLALPGLLRGALDAEAECVTEKMMVAAAYALADLVSEKELNEQYVLPTVFRRGLVRAVAEAVAGVENAD